MSKKSSKKSKKTSELTSHKKQGTKLVSSFNAAFSGDDKMNFNSWMHDRLPEMLWAEVVFAAVARDRALKHFRHLFKKLLDHPQRENFNDLTHTGLSKLDEELFEFFVESLSEPLEVQEVLYSILIYEELPAYDLWKKHLDYDGSKIALDPLFRGVGQVLWHQTQQATDVRWVKLMAKILSGKLRMPQGEDDTLRELLEYPNFGDQRKVRPSIRSLEMSANPLIKEDMGWVNYFWEENLRATDCTPYTKSESANEIDLEKLYEAYDSVCENLLKLWDETLTTTNLDVEHDTIFGMSFYALRTYEEVFGSGVSTGVLGRMALRCVLETRITLAFLIKESDDNLWRAWREYGAGQAKLNHMKFNEIVDAPEYIDKRDLENIANEDRSAMFQDVELGNWGKSDLRTMSDKVGLKHLYDKHYSWTSGYSHGSWGAVRDSCFTTCVNPLHRLHRVPHTRNMPCLIDSLRSLVNEILEQLEDHYEVSLGARV